MKVFCNYIYTPAFIAFINMRHVKNNPFISISLCAHHLLQINTFTLKIKLEIHENINRFCYFYHFSKVELRCVANLYFLLYFYQYQFIHTSIINVIFFLCMFFTHHKMFASTIGFSNSLRTNDPYSCRPYTS